MKNVFPKILLIVFGVALGFLSAEFSLRLFGSFISPTMKAFVKEESALGARSGLRVAEGKTMIFRKKEIEEGGDIAVIGDSMVFGPLVTESETFPARLQESLGLRVLNLGVISASPCIYNEMIKMISIHSRKPPKIIFYSVFANDMNESQSYVRGDQGRLYYWDEEIAHHPHLLFRHYREKILEHSVLYHCLKRFLTFGQVLNTTGNVTESIFFKNKDYSFNFAETPYWIPQIRVASSKEGRENILKLIREGQRTSKSMGSRFVVILMPFKEQIYPPILKESRQITDKEYHKIYSPLYDTIYDGILQKFREEAIESIDLRPAFRKAAREGERLFWTNDGHLTPAGHRVVAEALKKFEKNQSGLGAM